MEPLDLCYMGAFLFFSIGVFSLPIPIKLRTGLMSLVLLATLYFLSSTNNFPLLKELISSNNFEKLGPIGTWIKTIIQFFILGVGGMYYLFVHFMTNILLLMVGVQGAFVTRAWFKYRNEATLKDFWKKVSQYLLIRWFLGIQVPLLTAYPVLRAGASQNSETYQVIPYVWSLDNAQFRMDLNHILVLLSIPLSIAVLAWWHKRYLNQHSCKESP